MAQTSLPGERHSVLIRPSKGWTALNLKELWRYRELAFFLTWRDIKVRYKQTALGAAWAVLQPFLTMVVFSLFFGRLAGIPSDNIPYPLFAYAALVPWTFFANGLNQSSNSLVGSENLIKKVFFPRLIVPLSSVIAALSDFMISFAFLLGMLFWFGYVPSSGFVVLIPLFLAQAFITSLGFGLWLSALNVAYRDIRFIVPFLSQFLMFATPIAYPVSLLPEKWRILYAANPMVGVVEGFRRALIGTDTAPAILLISYVSSLTIFITGIFFFLRMEKDFADVV